jgi:peptidoglycan/xylan/chitin deacetylase (PgdA/CDA1 family)
MVQKGFWPNNKKFALCLTHDVDELRKTYQYFTRSFRFLKKRDLSGLKNQFLSLSHKIRRKEPYWTFEELMDLERKLGVRSTFFFLIESAKVKLFDRRTWRHCGRRYNIRDKKVVEMIRKLHSGEWEVGLHGSFYSYNDLNKLKNEKEILEEVLGSKVLGIRQHNLNLDIPSTWRIHEELGFEYDSSFGFNDRIGFRYGAYLPFYPVDEKGKMLKLLVIPLAIEDIALFRYEDPWAECMKMIEEVERKGGVLTVLWHHSVFNELEYPGWAEMYKRIIRVCKEKNAWIATAGEIARWWNKR